MADFCVPNHGDCFRQWMLNVVQYNTFLIIYQWHYFFSSTANRASFEFCRHVLSNYQKYSFFLWSNILVGYHWAFLNKLLTSIILQERSYNCKVGYFTQSSSFICYYGFCNLNSQLFIAAITCESVEFGLAWTNCSIFWFFWEWHSNRSSQQSFIFR